MGHHIEIFKDALRVFGLMVLMGIMLIVGCMVGALYLVGGLLLIFEYGMPILGIIELIGVPLALIYICEVIDEHS